MRTNSSVTGKPPQIFSLIPTTPQAGLTTPVAESPTGKVRQTNGLSTASCKRKNKPKMKLSKLINTRNVEALSRQIQAAKVSRERFSLEIPVKDCANALYAAFIAEVQYWGGIFRSDGDTLAHIHEAAQWLANPSGTPSLMLMGLYGNGKTTLARAIMNLISFLSERTYGYNKRIAPAFITAKDICRMCAAGEKFKEQYDRYNNLSSEQILIIDDLGQEPSEVMVYGMIHTPIIDLICERYAHRRMTIFTTNLDTDLLKAKYGERVYDRLSEMLTTIVFENESYRPQNQTN